MGEGISLQGFQSTHSEHADRVVYGQFYRNSSKKKVFMGVDGFNELLNELHKPLTVSSLCV